MHGTAVASLFCNCLSATLAGAVLLQPPPAVASAVSGGLSVADTKAVYLRFAQVVAGCTKFRLPIEGHTNLAVVLQAWILFVTARHLGAVFAAGPPGTVVSRGDLGALHAARVEAECAHALFTQRQSERAHHLARLSGAAFAQRSRHQALLGLRVELGLTVAVIVAVTFAALTVDHRGFPEASACAVPFGRATPVAFAVSDAGHRAVASALPAPVDDRLAIAHPRAVQFGIASGNSSAVLLAAGRTHSPRGFRAPTSPDVDQLAFLAVLRETHSQATAALDIGAVPDLALRARRGREANHSHQCHPRQHVGRRSSEATPMMYNILPSP